MGSFEGDEKDKKILIDQNQNSSLVLNPKTIILVRECKNIMILLKSSLISDILCPEVGLISAVEECLYQKNSVLPHLRSM